MYAENILSNSPFKIPVLFNTPGNQIWLDIGNSGEVYGFVEMNEYLYCVIGLDVYKINANKVSVKIGTLGTFPDFVEMTENGLQVTILTASGAAYYYDEPSDTFGQITDSNYQLASSVCTLDGYTVFSKQGTGQFFISDLRDTRVYSALDVATAEALSDNLIKVVAFNRQLFLMGQKSIEIWYNSGVGTPPFQRVDGALIQRGISAKNSASVTLSGVYWIGDDLRVYRTQAYNPQVISTFAIEYKIYQMSKTEDFRSFIYTQAGHEFYCLTSESNKTTLIYDISTSLWHERGSFNKNGSAQQQWGSSIGINFNNQVIVNGVQDGKIYYLDLNTYSENGQEILSEVISTVVFDNYNKFTINNLVLVVDSGVGITEPQQGSDPMIMMSFSVDGGYTWQDRSPQPLGKIGNYRQRINWFNLGTAREFVLRFRISDPIKRTIIAAYIQTTDGGF